MKLKIRGVEFSYGSRKVLENITFEVSEGEILGILGPNGSGKTTLLRCINRVLEAKKGSILIDGTDIRKLSRKEIAKNIGVVPQDSAIHFPFTVFDIVLMGRTPHLGRLEQEGSEDIETAKKAMEITNTKHLADRLIDEISGGEKQRVIIARALAQEPKILLLDEPTLHLDINHQLEILELLRKLAIKNRLTIVLVSHDLNLASRYCHRMILLKTGKIHSAGKPQDVLTKDNIRDVFKIDVKIDYNEKAGILNIIPLSPTVESTS